MRQTHKDYWTDISLFPLTLNFIAALLYLLRFIPQKLIILFNMSHCVNLTSTYKDSVHTREITVPELKQLRSTCQGLNTLERADKSSTLWIYFSQTKSQAVLAYSMVAMCSKRGNRDWSLEMHAKIKTTPAGKVTAVLQSRSGNFMPEPNTWRWKVPHWPQRAFWPGPFCLQFMWPFPLPLGRNCCSFPGKHACTVILNALQTRTGFHLLTEDCQVSD